MYLKRLDIHGFKTFAEKTQIVFTPGVTCVIGPNGSGKSNIADAILWVLGENNVRSLRGSSSQDVIFAGNERRRPLGMAEVSLTLDNTGGILPLDFSEITVTRRLYRSGESECLINRVSCRLRDVYELFLDTGVGRDAYSMVNQGQIDQILSVRAEDRREIFEEAAGIKKYRVRKREAERKLEHTAQNLLRVNDIIAEIEAQLGPLQRQAAAARRYRDLSARLRVLEDAFYGSRLRRLAAERESLARLGGELGEERARLDTELTAVQESEREARTRLQELDHEGEAQRRVESAAMQRVAAAGAERARAEERAAEVQRRLKTLERELEDLSRRIEEQVTRAEQADREEAALRRDVDALRTELAGAQQRATEAARRHEEAAKDLERRREAWLARARRQAELEARVQSLQGRLGSLRQGAERAREAREDGQAELERLQAERQSFQEAFERQRSRATALTQEADALRKATRSQEEALASARSRAETAAQAHTSHQARLQALSELGERGEGAAAGAKLLLAAVRRGQFTGEWALLVERLAVPEGLEKAVEAALGVYADAVLCPADGQALRALKWLRSQKQAAVLLPGTPAVSDAPLPGTLGAQVAGEGAALEWGRHLVARARACENLDEAEAARAVLLAPLGETGSEAVDARLTYVGRDGTWVATSGAASGGAVGSEGAAAALLARRRELERLREEAPSLEAAAAEARDELRKAEGALRTAQVAYREKSSAAEAARLEQQAQLREAERRSGDAERSRQRLERLTQEQARAERELAASEDALAKAQAELAAGTGPDQVPSNELEAAVAALQEQVRALETGRRQAETVLSDLRVRLAGLEQRLQSAAAAARRAAEGGAYLDRQRADRLKEQRALVGESEQRQLSFGTLAQQAADADAEAASAREAQNRTAEARAEVTRQLSALSAQSADLGRRQRELLERAHRLEVEQTAIDAQRKHLGQQWLDAVLAAEEPSEPEGDLDAPRLTVERLIERWDAAAAETVLGPFSDPETEIGRLRRQVRSLGAVNPDAPEQLAAAQERYEFLTSQRADLEAARVQLEGAIQEIDAASRETFMAAFAEIARHFDAMFKRLFGGGATELRLTQPDDVLETGIDVIVQPPGKKQQNLLLLSGGERALTAAAMLFALLTVRPSPFCCLDEVDAPLDETNVGRFAQVLREFSSQTQFIVVTHNRGTMEAADTLYGVTMEERGVSKLLSCSLEDPIVREVAATTQG